MEMSGDLGKIQKSDALELIVLMDESYRVMVGLNVTKTKNVNVGIDI